MNLIDIAKDNQIYSVHFVTNTILFQYTGTIFYKISQRTDLNFIFIKKHIITKQNFNFKKRQYITTKISFYTDIILLVLS